MAFRWALAVRSLIPGPSAISAFELPSSQEAEHLALAEGQPRGRRRQARASRARAPRPNSAAGKAWEGAGQDTPPPSTVWMALSTCPMDSDLDRNPWAPAPIAARTI